MDVVLALLALAGAWVAGEILGAAAVGLINRLRPLAAPLLNGWTVALLWLTVPGSFLLLRSGLASASTFARIATGVAFFAAAPLALLATFAWRRRSAAARPRGELTLTRVLSGAVAILTAPSVLIIALSGEAAAWPMALLGGGGCVFFARVAVTGRAPFPFPSPDRRCPEIDRSH